VLAAAKHSHAGARASIKGWAIELTDGVARPSGQATEESPVSLHTAPGDKAGVPGTRLQLNQPKKAAHRFNPWPRQACFFRLRCVLVVKTLASWRRREMGSNW